MQPPRLGLRGSGLVERLIGVRKVRNPHFPLASALSSDPSHAERE
jgi:hypothetical protein